MPITIAPPAGPWTIADLARLPDVGYRFEIHEGNLVMMSPARRWHSRIARRLADALEQAGHEVDTEVCVKRSERDMRVADVAVFSDPSVGFDQAFWVPSQLAIVIEIVSDSSEYGDRVDKPHWYATAGIPEYWRVERGEDDEAVIFQHKLARTTDGTTAYVETGVTTLGKLAAESRS